MEWMIRTAQILPAALLLNAVCARVGCHPLKGILSSDLGNWNLTKPTSSWQKSERSCVQLNVGILPLDRKFVSLIIGPFRFNTNLDKQGKIMKNKSVSQALLTGLFVVLVLAASSSIVRAQCPSTYWIGGTGDWFTPGNWSGCGPNITDDAHINNTGQAQIAPTPAPTGTPPPAVANSLYLGDSQGDSGGVTVAGDLAILDVFDGLCRGTFYIGNSGSGGLSITNGGIVRSRYAYIAAAPKSHGNVTVKGTGSNSQSQWNLFGSAGNGCPGSGLFIGCTAPCSDLGNSYIGGTALVNVESPALISVRNFADATSVAVGLSGTLTGNGSLEALGYTPASQTATVYGTLAPALALAPPVLTIVGNLQLERQANTVFNVTPQIPQTLAQVAVVTIPGGGGGIATLDGKVSVTMTGTFTPFTLLHADVATVGSFFTESIKFPSGQDFAPEITYDANNVYLVLKTTH